MASLGIQGRRTIARERGAALLLMLAVLGLGAASLFLTAAARTDMQSGPARTSKAALKQAREALIGYAAAHGRLPRPALPDGGGIEFSGRCDSDASCTGLLPWVTLGLAPGDGWGKLLRYSVTPALTAAPIQPTVVFGTKRVLARQGAALHYLAGNAQPCSMEARCAAAVVLSLGRGPGGISVAGVRQAAVPPGHPDERINAGDGERFIVGPLSTGLDAPGGPYDDQLAWLGMDVVLNHMSRAGMLPRGQ